jgi:hypothetical protein
LLRYRSLQFTLALILFSLSISAQGQQPWSSVLSTSRAANWTNAGIQGGGGIPSGSWSQCGSTIAAYGSSGSAASPSTIINAVTACAGKNQYVQLGAGTFYLNAGIRLRGISGVELRGMGADQTHLIFSGTSSCAGGASACEVSFEDTNGEYPTGVGTSAQWTAGYSQDATTITVNNASALGITANQTLLVLDQDDTGYSGNTAAAGGSGVSGSAVDNGAFFTCADIYTGSTGCSYNGPDGSAARPHRWQEETVLVTGCSPSCSNNGSTTITITPGLIHPNWAANQSPEVWSIQANNNVGMADFSVDGAATTNGQFGVSFNDVFNFWARGLRISNTYAIGLSMWNVLFGDVESNYVYNAGQSVAGTDPNPRDPSGILLNGSGVLLANNIVQWDRLGIINNGPSAGNVIAYNYLNNCFESNGDLWGCIWDGHSNGTDFNLYEGNVAPQAYQDQTHGGKLAETYFRNLLLGWESCSNGNCSAGSPPIKQANLDAISALAYNRYDNIVGNVLGTPGISTLAYSYTNSSQFWSSNSGTGHIFNLGSGNGCGGSGSGCAATAAIPIDPVVLSSTMWFDNWDAFNNATMACTGQGTPVAGCPQDQRAASAPSYPGLSTPSTTLPASFYFSARPSWWSSSIPFPAMGPDVSGGNVGQCGGTANQAGQYALLPALASSQCAGQTLNPAWGGHVNAIPAMACYLNTMAGPPDGTNSSVLNFSRAACYGGGTTTSSTPPPAPSNLAGTVVQ